MALKRKTTQKNYFSLVSYNHPQHLDASLKCRADGSLSPPKNKYANKSLTHNFVSRSLVRTFWSSLYHLKTRDVSSACRSHEKLLKQIVWITYVLNGNYCFLSFHLPWISKLLSNWLAMVTKDQSSKIKLVKAIFLKAPGIFTIA